MKKRQSRIIGLNKLGNEKGSLLIATYLVIAVLTGLGAVFLLRAHNEMLLAQTQIVTTQTLHIAEAGLERAISDIIDDFQDGGGGDSLIDGVINGYDTSGLDGTDTDSYYDLVYGDNTFGAGQYNVRLRYLSNDQFAIESTGQINDATQTVEAILKIFNMNVWDNAVFIGDNFLDGQVRIQGSLFILGDNLTNDDIAFDMRGIINKIFNNYDTLIQQHRDLLPDLPIIEYNGQMVQSLDTTVRVKNGIVAVSGSAKIGKPDQDYENDDEKETVTGVYIGDGTYDQWGGNKGEDSVYSDNGTETPYDLGDKMTMPTIDQDFIDNYKADAFEYTGNIVVRPDTVFEFGNGASQYGGANGGCGAGATNCFSSDGNGNLVISGQIYVNGSLTTDKRGLNKSLEYTGKGTMFTSGDIEIKTHLKTPAGDNPSFPDNVMGFMTAGAIVFSRPQIDVMGAFYAQQEIEIKSQTQVFGTLVSNFVTENSVNMSRIYQVPELADNLPPGMIGTEETTLAVFVTGWQKKAGPAS